MLRSYVGVTIYNTDPWLKRAATMVDKIVTHTLPRHLAASPYEPMIQAMPDVFTTQETTREEMEEAAQAVFPGVKLTPVADANVAEGIFEFEAVNLEYVLAGIFDIGSRNAASALRRVDPNSAYVPLTRGMSLTPDMAAGRAEVLRIIVEQLPLPNDETPWEAILDWRSDEEARVKYTRLRAWINDISKSSATIADAEDELAALLVTYKDYMKIQHKKFARSRFEAIVLVLAEVMEDLARFKLSSAVSALFSIRRDQIALLESEFQAPGRQVAYVFETEQRLQ